MAARYRKKWIHEIDVHYFYPYEGGFKNLFLGYKEHYDKQLAGVFLFPFRSLIKKLSNNRSIVCAPSSEERNKQRGFDPNTEMIETIGLNNEICFVKEGSKLQKSRTVEERASIIHELKLLTLPKHKEVFLFDDVCTTGNTLYACKTLLERLGYQVICVSLSIVKNERQ